MLRALSTPTSKFPVGSPSGRPPLAKPPRPATAPLAAAAAGPSRPCASGSLPSSGGGAALGAAAEEDKDETDSECCSPCSSAASGARQSSAPMSIPAGAGAAAGRRLRSSGDLWALQQAAQMQKPLSAPAVSHMRVQPAAAARGSPGAEAAQADAAQATQGAEGGPGSRRTSSSSTRGADVAASPPAARLPLIPGTLESESSGSGASSLFPTSCSPQLPFAFTPSAQSVSSFGARGPLQVSLPGSPLFVACLLPFICNAWQKGCCR